MGEGEGPNYQIFPNSRNFDRRDMKADEGEF
jgi:hypothetical protein